MVSPEHAAARKMSVIIVNWNGWQDTVDCLESLSRAPATNMEVIVIDNGSTNDSVARLRDVALPFTLIETGENLGFAGGNNRGIQHALDAGTELIWLLNNDTIVDPAAPDRLRQFATDHRDAADFFGSWIAYHDQPERLWFGGGEYDHRSGEFGHRFFDQSVRHIGEQPVQACAWISGCSLVVHASTLRRVGMMDEDLFLYREEVDWQLRANPRAPLGLILPEPLVRHKVGQSTGSSSSYLGAIFMSRNFLKLMIRYGDRYRPRWLLRWAKDFLAKPLIKRDWATVRGSIASVGYYRTPGKSIVASVVHR